MLSFTPKEMAAMLARMPERAEVLLVMNAGAISTMCWTASVLEKKSPTETPGPRRWAHDMLAGFNDAMGGAFFSPEPEEEEVPPAPAVPNRAVG